MWRSLLLVALLALPAWAETKVLPSPGKAVGVVTSDDPGKWIVLAADFMPVSPDVRDGGKVCIFEGLPGRYAVFLIPPGDGQPKISIVILGGAGPVPPGPTTTPTVPPTIPQVTPPAPVAGMRVLILDETNPLQKPSNAQVNAIRSPVVRAYLDSKALKGTDGTAQWRKYDPNSGFNNLPREWQDLRAKVNPSATWPWVIIADGAGTAVYQGPYPATDTEALALFQKFGG